MYDYKTAVKDRMVWLFTGSRGPQEGLGQKNLSQGRNRFCTNRSFVRINTVIILTPASESHLKFDLGRFTMSNIIFTVLLYSITS